MAASSTGPNARSVRAATARADSRHATAAPIIALAQEVAGFGIKVTLIEPGGYSTDWAGSSATHADPLPAYQGVREAFNAAMTENTSAEAIGDPVAAGSAILKIVDAEKPPLRVLYGTVATQIAPAVYQQRLDEWEQWKSVSIEANGR